MILLDDFYVITELSDENNTITGQVKLDPTHKIFVGHFPENPVLPGVCMMQMIKEILQVARKRSLILSEGNSVKFMNIINPLVNPQFTLQSEIIEETADKITVKTIIKDQEKIFLKFQGSFQTV